ncbi:hypothetical protein D0Z07_4722 [Hyphodiscus hymeniophilus]|uniref:DUF8035 domain-containing protein n=1 Tax=Hyphodiscus hymeniophilus TaxID=353542 RepID=A0A9P6VIM2_9HELO|nr:hypothetical protein D0Z07_4722 [Hyphodiscus hymeniophilus]
MSFGASPSDIIIVVTFCRALYRKCRDAGGEYDEISREVRGLHTVLRHLKYEVEAPESPLNKDHTIWGRQLAPIIGDCDFTLRQLDGLIMKYGRLANNGGGSPTTTRILWDRVKFGSSEMDQLGGIRVKLISHKTSLTLFLDTIQLHQTGKMATTLDNHGGQLDVILDKVDNIAARMTAKSGSVMTSYEDDDKQVWRQFRRELVAEGFSSDVLQQHKDVLRAYIRQIDQEGLLTEVTTDPKLPPPPVGRNTERWLESVHTDHSSPSVSSEDVPPSFDSNTGTDDSGAKELVAREENMKFPQSMKMERPKPESRRDGISQRQLDIPNQEPAKERTKSDASQKPLSKPKLITSNEKEDYYLNTDGSSEESESEAEATKRSKSPSAGQIIRTSDLIAQSQALTIRPAGSLSSYKSSQGSFIDDDVVPRSMAYRAKKQPEFGISPSRPNAIPVPANDRLGTSPRSEPIRLKPDAQGNEIPAEAKWTKINRRLVSPEVLEQDRLRYEAHPDFVAILGVLSRAEIQSLAIRSHDLRTARHRRNHPPPPQGDIPPSQPSRPIPVPIPAPVQQTRARGGRDTPSSESDHHSSDSDHHARRPRYEEHKSYPNYTHSPNTGYPNPFGQPVAPPSPAWSPVQQSQPTWMLQPPPQGTQGGAWAPSNPQQGQKGAPTLHPSASRGEGRNRDREPRRRHSSPPRSRDRERERERERERGEHRERDHGHKEKEKSKSRWKENLTAASIGGAAVSLLNVLSEAAEGL